MSDESGEGANPCPTCERDDFASAGGMKVHHHAKHGGKIGTTELVCQQCGADFTVPDAKAENGRKYCSNECQGEASRSPQVKRTCRLCGDEFTIAEHRLKDELGEFCSHSCSASSRTGERHSRWSGGPPVSECEWCGDEFEGHRGNPNRFCSVGCADTALAKERTGENHPLWRDGLESECGMCGDTFRPQVTSNPGRFCSRDCKHEFQTTEKSWTWAGGPFPYGPGFTYAKKEAVRESQGRKCDGCGLDEQSHLEENGCRLHVHHKIPARQLDDPEQRNSIENLVALCSRCHSTAEAMAPLYPFAD